MVENISTKSFVAEPETNSLKRITGKIRNGELSLKSYIAQIRKRFELVEPHIKAFLDEPNRFERLHREAKQLEAQYDKKNKLPLLYGIPVGIKDLFNVDGFETKAGSNLPSDIFKAPEGQAVKAIKSAGALILGKTVTTEFAYFTPGPTCNPHNLNHTPGGSSSGSAAAVASGLTPFALGTQTIGSIIRPAAFCGIVGFKPSQNRIATNGIVPFSPNIDQIGFFTSDVESAELAASVLCEKWSALQETNEVNPAFSKKRSAGTLCVPEGVYLQKSQPEALAHFEKAVERLKNIGFEIIRIDMMKNFEAIVHNHNTLIAAEAAIVHKNWFEKYSHLYNPKTIELILKGRSVNENEIGDCKNSRTLFRSELIEMMVRHQLTAFITPSTVGHAPHGLDSTGDPIMNLPWTFSGLPAINLPVGKFANGLPFGLQVVGNYWKDEELLKIASVIESSLRDS
ncbi:MAG: amidase [Bacteroidota bacterium]|nr:amidase [Bacteroidota bacterium]